jgi:hypothetical protein
MQPEQYNASHRVDQDKDQNWQRPDQGPSAPESAARTIDYTSHPFKATSLALGKVLTVNPVSVLTVGLIALAVSIGGYLAIILLSLVIPGNTAKILASFVAILFVILVVLRALGASTVLNLASFKGQQLTGRQALGSASAPGFWSLVGSQILTGILVFIGFLLLIVPGMILLARLSLTPFVIYDERLGAIAAMKRSWSLTKGHTVEMLGALFASFFVVGGSGGLLSVVGSQAGQATRYAELKAASAAQASTGKVHWLNPFIVILSVLAVIAYFGFIAFTLTQTFRDLMYKPYSTEQTQLDGLNTQQQDSLDAQQQYCYDSSASNPLECPEGQSCGTYGVCQDTTGTVTPDTMVQ